ncbi:fimbrial protein [Escherichia albertii]|uniref:Fimbrial protein n=2 Tax=Escherichia TaxID=561 RepID=A0A765T2H0_ECOLX|nr:fimbrial protein [Escherichia albertii]EEW0787201.1 fimbrial protein [Escherichia albertii]EEW4358973.1 fimbrial protein [Escherichia albertii]EEW6709872.1 fimbrial protein [Escherichia albertii]EEW7550824.1 fimbrial protein [Escherichia albertii]EJJ6391757.1 fimbrial protein [Escherichia albertii]
MLKKSVIAAALVMFTTSAFALDGGQLDFAGLVSDNTCELHVNGGAQDGQINLQTATTSEVNLAGVVQVADLGAKPEAFSITVDCSLQPQNSADLSMGSVFFSNSQGTLNNDLSINQAATGVAIAIHYLTDATTYEQMKINDSTDVKHLLFTNGKAVYNFKASYVKQAQTVQATAGYVKTNAAYTITYQ